MQHFQFEEKFEVMSTLRPAIIVSLLIASPSKVVELGCCPSFFPLQFPRACSLLFGFPLLDATTF